MQNCPNSGKPCFMAIPSQAPMGRPRVAVLDGEGVETRRAAPTLQRGLPARPEHGEGIVQTTNPPAWGEAAKAVAGKKIRRAAMPVGVRVPPPAPLPLCSALGCGKKPCSVSRKGRLSRRQLPSRAQSYAYAGERLKAASCRLELCGNAGTSGSVAKQEWHTGAKRRGRDQGKRASQ